MRPRNISVLRYFIDPPTIRMWLASYLGNDF